ncbi:helix-hairpin-helix domain-containing protein [Citromicrobium sp. JLT1363]|uniref:helix-hairpin-helix domain-containing protein n=1 Tax=Citromicrobium sp. JLT1363 TaxID=517722 RepID=UPI0002D32549|nr:helix-hairpin-helix domain-containing protein [Citromicrobium sp. JLT1363]
MRTLKFLVPAAATALALAACSEAPEATTDETAATAETETDTAAVDAETTVLDANTATAEDLAAVEGVSPELADAIVAGQPYASVTDLNAMLMETLDEDEAQAVLVNVFVPIDLNTASEEEIRLVPGMTDKMVHEFEEYRPYADMGVFDREIGKYVDEEEVARLRQYVTL